MLGRLALELLAGRDVGNEGEVHVADVAAADVVLELADGLEEGQRLDVAHGPADLDDHDIRFRKLVFGDPEYALLDLVGDVGNDLDGPPKVIATPFLGDHARVDATGGDVARLGERDVDEALVMAEVEVGLSSIVGDEDLAVLIWRHGAGIDVQVRVELLHPDVKPPSLEDRADGGGGDALAQGGDDTAGHEHELGHRGGPPGAVVFPMLPVTDWARHAVDEWKPHSASGPAGPRRPPPAQPAPRGSRITTRVSSAVPIAPVRLSLGWVGRASSVSPISLANLSTGS